MPPNFTTSSHATSHDKPGWSNQVQPNSLKQTGKGVEQTSDEVDKSDYEGQIHSPQDAGLMDLAGNPTALLSDNPFLSLNDPMTAYEWSKVVLLAPLGALRIILVAILLLAASLVCILATLGASSKQPLPPFKSQLARSTVKVIGRAIIFTLTANLVRFEGWEHYREGHEELIPLVFNHVSYLDALVMATYFAPCGVAKSSVATLPVVGPIARGLQFLFVARSGSTDKLNKHTIEGDRRAEVQKRLVDPKFPTFMIAPEGTTKARHCMMRFSLGAFAPGQPIQPVLLDYSRNHHFNPGWGLPESLLWQLWRMMTQFVVRINLKLLPVYRPSAEERSDARLFAENVRALMARELSVPTLDFGTREEFRLKRFGVSEGYAGKHIIMQPKGRAPLKLISTAALLSAREHASSTAASNAV